MRPVTSSRPEQPRIIRIVQSRVVWLGLEAHHHQSIYLICFHWQTVLFDILIVCVIYFYFLYSNLFCPQAWKLCSCVCPFCEQNVMLNWRKVIISFLKSNYQYSPPCPHLICFIFDCFYSFFKCWPQLISEFNIELALYKDSRSLIRTLGSYNGRKLQSLVPFYNHF